MAATGKILVQGVIAVTTSLVILLSSVSPHSYSQMEAVYDHIRTTSSTLRPVRNNSDITEVYVIFNLIAITQVDEIRQELTCNAWLNLTWRDEVRNWNKSDYGGIDVIHPAPTDIWRPRVMVSNSLEDRDVFKDEHAPVSLWSGGRASWYPGGIFRTSCRMIMTVFPFDSHRCVLSFVSNNYYSHEVAFTPSRPTANTRSYSDNGEWELVSSSVEYASISARPDEVFPNLLVSLTVTRRPTFFLLNVVLPVMLLAVLCFMGFLLPEAGGEKVSFGTTMLLSQAVYMTVVTDLLPKTSDSVPLVLIYLFAVLVLCALAVAVTILAMALRHATPAQDDDKDQTSEDTHTDNDKLFFKLGKNRLFPADTLPEVTLPTNSKKTSASSSSKKATSSHPPSPSRLMTWLNKGPVLFFTFLALWFAMTLLFLAHGIRVANN